MRAFCAMQQGTQEKAHSRPLLKIFLALNIVAPLTYAASLTANPSDSSNVSLAVQNISQIFIVLILGGFLAIVCPDGFETPAARRFVGPLLLVSDIGDLVVCYEHALLYAARPRATTDECMRLAIHVAIVVYVVGFGVVYPTVCFFLRVNSWARIRWGLLVDGLVFLTAVLLLWGLGETRFPPGDLPFVAAFGRPIAAFVGAATFCAPVRHRIDAWATRIGLRDVYVKLVDLRGDELRRLIGAMTLGFPSAAGNTSTASSDAGFAANVVETQELSSVSDLGRVGIADNASAGTAKVVDQCFIEMDLAELSSGGAARNEGPRRRGGFSG